MDWKKRTAALAAALLLALAPISALAETWSTEDFSFQAPENMREFTLDTPWTTRAGPWRGWPTRSPSWRNTRIWARW